MTTNSRSQRKRRRTRSSSPSPDRPTCIPRPSFEPLISDAIDAGERRLVIDLTEATFIDSMTLGVLLGALKRLVAVDGRLVIVCPDKHLRRVFEITSLDRVLDARRSRRTMPSPACASRLHEPGPERLADHARLAPRSRVSGCRSARAERGRVAYRTCRRPRGRARARARHACSLGR